jgi:hypothetical protein
MLAVCAVIATIASMVAKVRHAKSKTEDWGPVPSRSDELADAVAEDVRDPAKRAPGHKDTRMACKGKPGRWHAGRLVYEPRCRRKGCGWTAGWIHEDRADGIFWWCGHRERCENCQKVLRERPEIADAECPDYPGEPAQLTAAAAALVKLRERRASWHRRPRPVINGQQGYRRPRKTEDANA